MKIIKIELTKEEQLTLEKICRSFSDYRSERALAVLHCAKGKKATQIAEMLNKTIQTICIWLKAYQKNRIHGLNRKYSPGRPSIRQQELIPLLDAYLSKSPYDYGWGENVWGTKVIIAQFQRDAGISLSQATVERALHDAGKTLVIILDNASIRAHSAHFKGDSTSNTDRPGQKNHCQRMKKK